MKNPAANSADAVSLAREVLETEAAAITALISTVGADFQRAVELILGCRGRVTVSGVGKSGHIARKIAATMSSTGTPAYFVHAGEASHGDLGVIAPDDVFIALSNSGEGAELLAIVPAVKRQGAALIALTGDPQSTLAREADVHLYAGAAREACPLNLAPTASTTAALALGDALALAVMQAKGFSRDEFARSHPGGALGRRLLTHVSDVMRGGEALPRVGVEATLAQAIAEVTRGGMGMTAVVEADGRVAGIFTDGDLRRALGRPQGAAALASARVADLMTRAPRTIAAGRLAAEAVQLMEQHRITQLLVTDDEGGLVGALNTHDLLKAKVI